MGTSLASPSPAAHVDGDATAASPSPGAADPSPESSPGADGGRRLLQTFASWFTPDLSADQQGSWQSFSSNSHPQHDHSSAFIRLSAFFRRGGSRRRLAGQTANSVRQALDLQHVGTCPRPSAPPSLPPSVPPPGFPPFRPPVPPPSWPPPSPGQPGSYVERRVSATITLGAAKRRLVRKAEVVIRRQLSQIVNETTLRTAISAAVSVALHVCPIGCIRLTPVHPVLAFRYLTLLRVRLPRSTTIARLVLRPFRWCRALPWMLQRW